MRERHFIVMDPLRVNPQYYSTPINPGREVEGNETDSSASHSAST
jgi:hypothetical protein